MSEQSHSPERVRALIRAKLHEVAALVALAEGLENPLRETVTDGELAVTLCAVRSAVSKPCTDGRNLTDLPPCERDAYLVLLNSPRPLTKARIKAALEARGQIYGDSTLEHALPRLVHRRWVRNSKQSPKGYSVIPPGEEPPVTQPSLFGDD